MKRQSLLVLLLVGLAGFTAAVGQRTTRRNITAAASPAPREDSSAALRALVAPAPETFKISGYDKPLRSRRESFFASNHDSGYSVRRVALTVTYLDSGGKMLHRRSVSVPCDIPAGETRNLSIPSWDSQQSFYFVRSTVPARVAQATPYDVTIAVDTIFVNP